MQGGGAAVARGQPAGQTAARRRCAVRSDILLPPRVRLPAETVAEEADALTKTPPQQPTPPPPRHRPPRRAPSPRFFHAAAAAVVAFILFINMIILLLLRTVSIVFALFLNYYYYIVERCKTTIRDIIIIVLPMSYDLYDRRTGKTFLNLIFFFYRFASSRGPK